MANMVKVVFVVRNVVFVGWRVFGAFCDVILHSGANQIVAFLRVCSQPELCGCVAISKCRHYQMAQNALKRKGDVPVLLLLAVQLHCD